MIQKHTRICLSFYVCGQLLNEKHSYPNATICTSKVKNAQIWPGAHITCTDIKEYSKTER